MPELAPRKTKILTKNHPVEEFLQIKIDHNPEARADVLLRAPHRRTRRASRTRPNLSLSTATSFLEFRDLGLGARGSSPVRAPAIGDALIGRQGLLP